MSKSMKKLQVELSNDTYDKIIYIAKMQVRNKSDTIRYLIDKEYNAIKCKDIEGLVGSDGMDG